jgi:rsbT co-antagonist protein RsbR
MRGAKNGLWDYKPIDPTRPVDPDYPVYVSDGLLYMTGRTRADTLKTLRDWSMLVHPDDAGWVEQSFLKHIREKREYTYLEYRLSRTDGAAIWVGTTWQALWDGRGGLLRFAGALMDITERRQVEAELREKLAVIERQASAIRELSTPILEVHEGVLCLPVVGVVDSRRASEMMDAALGAAAQRGARFLLLDLTGVSVLDTSTADQLLSIARAVRLLGAEVVITGLGAAAAQTVVTLGVSLDEITTLRSLKEGLRYCLRASVR